MVLPLSTFPNLKTKFFNSKNENLMALMSFFSVENKDMTQVKLNIYYTKINAVYYENVNYIKGKVKLRIYDEVYHSPIYTYLIGFSTYKVSNVNLKLFT